MDSFKLINRLILLVALVSSLASAHAQEGILSEKSLGSEYDYAIRFWNSETGLPQNSILSCVQTQDGFLWMSTTNGLVRYDGNSFKVFNTQNTPGLTDNCIVRLFEDSRGDLWMITSGNKLLRYSKGIFINRLFSDSSDVLVTAITENDKMEVVISLINGNICSIRNGKLATLLRTGQVINSLVFSKGDGLYFSNSAGVYLVKKSRALQIKNVKPGWNIRLKKSSDETVWAYDSFGYYEINDTRATRFDFPAEVVAAKPITDIALQKEGSVWVATTYGIYILEGTRFSRISTRQGLPTNSVTTLLKDKNNNIWVGTSNAGVCKLKYKTVRTFSQEDGLLDDGCGPLLNYKDSSVLISNLCKEVALFDKGKISLFNKEHIGCIWSLLYKTDQTLYLGTYGSGLFTYKDGKMAKCLFRNPDAPAVCLALFEDRENKIWAGTKNGLYTIINEDIVCVKLDEINSAVTCIMQDSKGRIWFCCEDGLGVLEDNVLRLYKKEDGLPHNKVRSVYEDKEGVFWIATYGGGIVRFKNNRFFAFDQAIGVMDENTSCIIEDDFENLWVSSNRGIFCIKKKDLNDYADKKSLFLSVKCYGSEDGMKSIECNGGFQGAGIKTKAGEILFPTLGGVVVIDPAEIHSVDNTSPVFLESILVDDKLVTKLDSLSIASGAGGMVFNFTSPYFGEHALLFQYQLEGYDKDWSVPQKKRSVSYGNLPPGDYKFRVRVYGNLEEKDFIFSVPFPFWRTKIFFACVTFAAGLLMMLLLYLFTERRKQKEDERIRINKQYAALELKALQSQMNPHFLFNCLNTIKYFIATDDKSAAGKYLNKFSRMIRLFLEHSNANWITLENEINLLSNYVEMEQLRLEKGFTFNLVVDEKIDLKTCEIPAMILQPFIENAIHHGLKNAPRAGVLSLSFIKEIDQLKIQIDDNGVGRKNAEVLKHVSANGQKSLGMQLTRERIETLNYIKSTAITLHVNDKTSNNEALGTLVTITIPLNLN